MASELKQDEEGMAEILQTNETVIRVMDRYKAIFGEPPSSTSSSTTTSTTATTSSTSTATGGSATPAMSSSGATGGGGNIGEGATAASKQDDILIDLLDLDLGPPPSGGAGAGGGNLASGSGASLGGGGAGNATNLGSLLDDFESLSKNTHSNYFCTPLSLSLFSMLLYQFHSFSPASQIYLLLLALLLLKTQLVYKM